MFSSSSSNIKSRPFTPYRQPNPVPGKRRERIAVALEYLHDEYGNECCLEEVLARIRGYKYFQADSRQNITNVTNSQKEPKELWPNVSDKHSSETLGQKAPSPQNTRAKSPSTIPNVQLEPSDNNSSPLGQAQAFTTSVPLRDDENKPTKHSNSNSSIQIAPGKIFVCNLLPFTCANRFHIFLESPNRRPASPTMTMMTKEATDDVYEMFNQPLKSDQPSDSDDDVMYNDDEDDYSVTNTRNLNSDHINNGQVDEASTNPKDQGMNLLTSEYKPLIMEKYDDFKGFMSRPINSNNPSDTSAVASRHITFYLFLFIQAHKYFNLILLPVTQSLTCRQIALMMRPFKMDIPRNVKVKAMSSWLVRKILGPNPRWLL